MAVMNAIPDKHDVLSEQEFKAQWFQQIVNNSLLMSENNCFKSARFQNISFEFY